MTLPPENVQDYPRPPRLELVPYRIEIACGGETIADTTRAFRVLETHHAPTYYLPPDDIRAKLSGVPGRSYCEWKGAARYFNVLTNGFSARRAAWCYPNPSAAFAPLAGYVAFYANLMETCRVGGARATPQPGGFYGGWVTPNLSGTVKGAPGTENW
ncbi:uncharacterized protein (DUF427 family) [Aliiruegeria haliotis]|uniref:Uncharacterized protein (DUF427 family) n=1 Tax=Aliiruegeria haliotis TaxID=1280846 RepID=A0A2T0RMB1_9RHOB|nr:DUF427 domain-containing protein [Aliiruegeria haliotis]PRY22253.1 uncharacterized protein (DUF427 family) [Aliiruegeria haliotis]